MLASSGGSRDVYRCKSRGGALHHNFSATSWRPQTEKLTQAGASWQGSGSGVIRRCWLLGRKGGVVLDCTIHRYLEPCGVGGGGGGGIAS